MRPTWICARVQARPSGAVLLLAGMLAVSTARAETVLLADTTLVSGTSTAVFSFNVPGPGTVDAQVSNLDWPQPLTSLTFMATTGNQVLSSWSDGAAATSQTLLFKVTAGTYFADVLTTAGGPLDLGLYSLSLTFTPAVVPLPSSLGLLLGGLAVCGLLVRRARRAAV
jgi:hypothetical protein